MGLDSSGSAIRALKDSFDNSSVRFLLGSCAALVVSAPSCALFLISSFKALRGSADIEEPFFLAKIQESGCWKGGLSMRVVAFMSGCGGHLALLLFVLQNAGQRGNRDGFDGFGGFSGHGGFGHDGYSP